MLKQISLAAFTVAAVIGSTSFGAHAFPAYLPNAILAASQAGERSPMVAQSPQPVAERSPMVFRIGGRAHLFDGFFYCERPSSPLPKIFDQVRMKTPRQTLSFLDR